MVATLKNAGPIACLTALLAASSSIHAQPASAPQPVGANEVFARWDKDHNKTLSQDEFKAGWDQVQANLLVFKLRENFSAMDSNRNGVLDATEYANLELVRKAGTAAPPMSAFDSNKSQGLDFKEYLAFIKAMMKPKP
jgi:Ca2+-binding EF-hand superfamily protein